MKRFIEKLNINLKCKLYIKLLYLILFLLVIFHFMATVWVIVEAPSRVSPLFWIDYTLDALPKTKLFVYMEAFHYSLIGGLS